MSRHVDIPVQADGRAAEMRDEFDLAFSQQPVSTQIDLTDVIALRIGDEPALLRLSEIAEVVAHPVLTAVPTTTPALLGLTAARNTPIAGYDLGLLLGRAPVEPRWMVLAAADPGVGLVFEHFDGYHRISLEDGGSQQIITMASLIETITRFTRHRYANQESTS